MKKLIKDNAGNEIITLSSLFALESYELEAVLIGIKISCGQKYVYKNKSFVNGVSCWDRGESLPSLLGRILKDTRCEVFIFNDIKEFGRWLAE